LRELKEHFELVLFTSSSRIYCEAVVNNVIENEEKFFDYKLFKQHCTNVPGKKGACIKNLDILLKGRELKDLVIVDNRAENYITHLSNGIPINDFNGSPEDEALFQLSIYLKEKILPADDAR
jgi:TFIIF-interacting CTD phosphatase-like protein